jgi:hypothetical protein
MRVAVGDGGSGRSGDAEGARHCQGTFVEVSQGMEQGRTVDRVDIAIAITLHGIFIRPVMSQALSLPCLRCGNLSNDTQEYKRCIYKTRPFRLRPYEVQACARLRTA